METRPTKEQIENEMMCSQKDDTICNYKFNFITIHVTYCKLRNPYVFIILNVSFMQHVEKGNGVDSHLPFTSNLISLRIFGA